MAESASSIYRVTEIIGTSSTSWEDAAKNAVETAGKSLSGQMAPQDFMEGQRSAEDLKAIYFEALTAQPGAPRDSVAMADWFWGETAAARVINAIREICLGMRDNEFQLLGKLLLVPRSQLHRFARVKNS